MKVNSNLPYAPIIDRIFNTHNQKKLLQTDTEIMLTNMYVFYVKKVFHGITSIKPTRSGGFTPKNVSYEHFRFSLTDPNLLSKMKTYYLANIINFVKPKNI
jgi:hypothetical protein